MRVVSQTEKTAAEVTVSKIIEKLDNIQGWLIGLEITGIWTTSSTEDPADGISARLNMPLFFVLLGNELYRNNRLFLHQVENPTCIFFFFLHFGTPNIPVYYLIMNILLRDSLQRESPLSWWDKYSNSFCLNWLPWSSCLFWTRLTSFLYFMLFITMGF